MLEENLEKRVNNCVLDPSYPSNIINVIRKYKDIEGLKKYQLLHTFTLIDIISEQSIALDGSDTGTGKTYTSIALCKTLGLKPFIICPKQIIHHWINVCNTFSISPLGVVNYESIKKGKYYDNEMNRVPCPYYDIERWYLPKDSIIIFDEVHVCKKPNSQNGKLLRQSIQYTPHIKVLLLSATVADNPSFFSIFAYALGMTKSMRSAKRHVEYNVNQGISLYDIIYPKYGSRMDIREIGDEIPQNRIEGVVYTLDKEQIDKVNTIIQSSSLYSIVKKRIELEHIKANIIISLARNYIENGFSVVIFLNFRSSVKKVSRALKTTCIVEGLQDYEDREENIRKFQMNESKVIICNIATGGQSINLHDTYGDHPRISLISPSFSAIQFKQALGRIHRAGQKTPSIQLIVYCACTIEERICNALNQKLSFLTSINDEDLSVI